jgi:phosphatidylglycerophosphate synthase
VRAVQSALLTGLAAALALLGLLDGVVGLTAAGWGVGVAGAAVTAGLLHHGLLRAGADRLGPANLVTLGRSILAGAVAALVTTGLSRPAPTAAIVTLASLVIALDAVDGWIARRTATASAVGARFDGEVDAFLILALSVEVAQSLAPWVLAIGLMRYAFLVAGRPAPWLRAALPPRQWRKSVAAIQGIVLTVAAATLLPAVWGRVAVAVALALLLESFGRDVWWLHRHRPAPPAPSGLRPAIRRVVAVVAVLVVWAALVVPDHLTELTPGAFLRVPVEGLLLVAVAVAVPPRPRRLIAGVAGVALGGLTLIRILDLGFFTVLDRPFNPVTDWGSFGPAIGVLSDSVGRVRAVLYLVAAGCAMVALAAVITLATLRVAALAARHRPTAIPTVTTLAVVWTLCIALGVTAGGGAPLASTSAAGTLTSEVDRARTAVEDQHAFTEQIAATDPYAGTAGSALLTGLRGKDVLLVFVESYGRVAVEGSSFSAPVDAVLRSSTRELQAVGYGARSAFLTSPTFGGISWLAHSTLQSGLWIDSQQRYDQLAASNRETLSKLFKRGGWRTVVDIPSSRPPWPEGQHLYDFDALYGSNDVGYRGPSFSYAKIPDQYTLAAFARRELAPAHRRPVMAEIDLVSSHTPWAPLPRIVPWQRLGDGSVYDPMPAQGEQPSAVWRDGAQVQAAYGESVQYSLHALDSFLQNVHDDNLVLIVLGDHQPATVVSGARAGHDVPVSIIARDPQVLARIAAWRWQPGLLPNAHAPVWRMDAFRNRFLRAFSAAPTAPIVAQP